MDKQTNFFLRDFLSCVVLAIYFGHPFLFSNIVTIVIIISGLLLRKNFTHFYIKKGIRISILFVEKHSTLSYWNCHYYFLAQRALGRKGHYILAIEPYYKYICYCCRTVRNVGMISFCCCFVVLYHPCVYYLQHIWVLTH